MVFKNGVNGAYNGVRTVCFLTGLFFKQLCYSTTTRICNFTNDMICDMFPMALLLNENKIRIVKELLKNFYDYVKKIIRVKCNTILPRKKRILKH